MCKTKGIDANVMFINENYKDCSFHVEMYPHSVDGSPELLACDYSITFKRVNKETSATTTIVEPICDKECTGAVILSDLFKLNIDDDTARAFWDILEDNSKLKNGESFTKKYEVIYSNYSYCTTQPSKEKMPGLYVLSTCLDHILAAVIKLHRLIGVEMRVSILKEFYGDCSLEVEVYPHRETSLSHNKVYEYFITFKKDNEKKSSSTTIGDGTHKGMTIKDLVFSDLRSLDIDNNTARELALIIQDTSNLEEGGFIHREI